MCNYEPQEKFRIPILGNCCIFPQIWEKVGEILGKIFPKLGKFWNPRRPFIFQKGIFLGKMIILFSQLDFGKIMVFFPILGKSWDFIFLLWENNGKNNGNILSSKQIQKRYFGKILGSVSTTQFFPNLFVFGT